MCNHVLPSTAVRDLGIIPMDNNVSMRSHVSRTVSRCFAAEVEPVGRDRRRPVKPSVKPTGWPAKITHLDQNDIATPNRKKQQCTPD